MNILLTGSFKYSKKQISDIENLGLKIDFLQYENEIVENPEKYEAVVCNGLFLHNDIEKFKNLRYIQLTSAGLEQVPMDYVNKHNITINNARGVYSIPMAEWAVLKILEIYKNSRGFYENQKNKKWEKNRSLLELFGKTAVIIGCGSIGIEIAKRLNAFDVNVLGVDIVDFKPAYFSKIYNFLDMEIALSKAYIVVLTAPLTEQTKNMINNDTISYMKDKSILINLSRGALVKENDLIKAIENEKFLGVALDVFNTEPLDVKSKLWGMKNVIITPHNSFIGEGNNERMFGVIHNKLKEWLYGKE